MSWLCGSDRRPVSLAGLVDWLIAAPDGTEEDDVVDQSGSHIVEVGLPRGLVAPEPPPALVSRPRHPADRARSLRDE